MNWMSMTVEEFQAALASKQATPGGGTAAAVALGQAAALTEMVCALTLGNEKWQVGWGAADHARTIAVNVMTRSGALAQEDSDAFNLVVSGFRLPKSSDEEKEVRQNAIRAGTLRAAEVPLETALLAMELLTVLEALATDGNANAASDIGVASLLASAAVKGALFNVEINVASLPEAMASNVVAESAGLRERCSEVSRGVMHAVHNRINQ